jgi:hypothetical protein
LRSTRRCKISSSVNPMSEPFGRFRPAVQLSAHGRRRFVPPEHHEARRLAHL